MITLDNVSKTYTSRDGETFALRGVNLEVKTGELVALLGPSGCGKTTTLMTIAGFLRPTEGRILFDGTMVNDREPRDRNIGMVFQSYALYPHLSVIDNIAFPLKYKGMDKRTRYEKAREIARVVRIEELLHRKPSQLSGGQQQRVAMARALVKKPVVLLLDEPMSNLDARLKVDVRDEIRLLQREIGVTTIIVTHDQEEAMAMADRIAVLDAGFIQQFDTPDVLYNRPGNLFVANFLGNPPMNIVEGTLVEDEGGTSFVSEQIRYQCSAETGMGKGRVGKRIMLGVRPDDVRVSREPSSRSIELRLELVEHMGGKRLLKGVSTGPRGKTPLRILVSGGREEYAPGETIHAELQDDRVHLFDAEEGGRRISA